jgi:ABC-2 type transport system ATP-binding protein
VLDRGRVIAEGSPDQLKSRIGGDRIDVVLHSAAELPVAAGIVGRICAAEPEIDGDTRRISAPVTERLTALGAVLSELDAAHIEAEDVALRRPTLDEVFLKLTGHRAEKPDEVAAV